MRRSFPLSLAFFAATGLLFVLQLIPVTGIILMFMLAMLWSVLLVNAGMIGVAVEAAIGRVSRLWLLLPIVFYGGYGMVAAQDHVALRRLAASYEAANVHVAPGFDPAHQALLLEGMGSGWLLANHALPVTYSATSRAPEGYEAHRLVGRAACDIVRRTPEAEAAGVRVSNRWTSGGRESGLPDDFCILSTPDVPPLPIVRVAQTETRGHEARLPVTRVTTTIAMPDGRRFTLHDGRASPLHWLPMPMIGCGLISSSASWQCQAMFLRDDDAPILPGSGRYERNPIALARALGLKPVGADALHGADLAPILPRLNRLPEEALVQQTAKLDAIIANPGTAIDPLHVDLIARQPATLAAHAEPIMAGIERAAAIGAPGRHNGMILTSLLDRLPPERLDGFGPRILALYDGVEDRHWLWTNLPLLRRLGDFGTPALAALTNPKALAPEAKYAGIEGLCRIGLPGRAVAGPVLLNLWTTPQTGFVRRRYAALFVAMRRLDMRPPRLADSRASQIRDFERLWGKVTPASPPEVCDVDNPPQDD